jgi:NAD(P)-dependent dehydrogenase (short-subunit alcohol dehydrogenase family)
VTGGALRVGRALCLALGEAGWAVAVHYRASKEDADSVVADIASKGGRAIAVGADLDDPEAAKTLLAAAEAGVGPVELLVNNASRFEKDEAQTFTASGFHRHITPNLLAPLLLAQAFAAAAERRRGQDEGSDPSIINILDQRVLRPNPQFFTYAVSKAGLHAATITLAQAFAPHVRVNAVAPGPTLPSVHQRAEDFQAEAKGVLLERPAALADLVDAVLYLAHARSVTGQVIAVDAGQHLGWRTPDLATDQDD